MIIDCSQAIDVDTLTPKTSFEIEVIDFLKDWFSGASTVKVKTSGSTGTPKIFDIEKERMRHSAKMTCDFLNLNLGDTAFLCLPVEYISGKMMVVRALEKGLKLRVATPSTRPLENLKQAIDFCAMTPLQVEQSLDKIHYIKKLIIGGAAVSESLVRKLQKLNLKDTTIYETYGMSETLSHIALKSIIPERKLFFEVFNEVKISTDNRGCLQIDAPYLNENRLVTNDMVELNGTNQFRFLGRVDHIINSGGAKIFPEQLEAMAKQYISQEVVFTSLPDKLLGERLIAVVEGKESLKLKTIFEHLPYEKKLLQPKTIMFISEIPRTPNGKVDRLALKTRISN